MNLSNLERFASEARKDLISQMKSQAKSLGIDSKKD